MDNVYVEVIINTSSIEIDKPFLYEVPYDKNQNIFVGSRVLVPFGKGNQTIEGYVVKIISQKPSFEVKKVSEIIDDSPIFNEKMLKLAYMMKEEYLCTLIECLKSIVPAGIGIRTSKIISLNKEFPVNKLKGELQKKIVQVLIDNNYEITYEGLIKVINKNCLSSINSLKELGAINVENKLFSSVSDKTQRVALLNISMDDANIYMDNLSDKFSAQKRILNILIDNNYIAVNDLVCFAGASYSAVNSLYKKGIITFEEIEIYREPYKFNYEKTEPYELSNEQREAYGKIIASIDGNSKRFLIHGITGSGKTEVYLQTIAHAVKSGGQAIVLVPEISLTPQMVERFKSRFGDRVAVLHSKLSLGERYDEWKKIRQGTVDIAIGARSAIFAPFSNLKLIIIDEEHETSYKSESRPKYNAKDIALMRRQIEGCTVVLGSATPLIDTYYAAKNGEIDLLEMTNRIKTSVLPRVDIVDMRLELAEGNRSIFSKALFEEVSKNIEKNEQTMLFLNRRGHSTFVSCRQCGFVLSCPNCNISLTYHSFNNMLVCHYCGFEQKNVSICPSCGSNYIKHFGIGTQKIEEEVKKIFSNATVLRMDFDTTSTKYSHQKILDKFRNENINILIGTQMIAKGHDFPNVTLVGVISADTTLNIDDFRAGERTFQLLTQVAGRAGRGEKPGRVIIQTYQPENYCINLAKNHDFKSFYEQEIAIRNSLDYPPFTDITTILVSHTDKTIAKDASFKIEDELVKFIKKKNDNNTLVYKPTPAPISYIKQLYRYRIIIKSKTLTNLREILRKIEMDFYKNVNINIDINPINML